MKKIVGCIIVALVAVLFFSPPVMFRPVSLLPLKERVDSSNVNDTVVVIIGASFSGLTAASELALYGYKVVVIAPFHNKNNKKELVGGCSIRGTAIKQMAIASNISSNQMLSILSNSNNYSYIDELVFGSGEVNINNLTTTFDEPEVKVEVETPGISIRHSDALKRFRSYLSSRGDVLFIDSIYKNEDDLEAYVKGYKRKVIINATPSLSLFHHPSPPPAPSSYVISAQVPCKSTETRSKFLPEIYSGLLSMIEVKNSSSMYNIAATAFIDDEYKNSDYYILVNKPLNSRPVEEDKIKITKVLKSIANVLNLEMIDPENSLFIGTSSVINGPSPLSSYYHTSADNSTTYITLGLAGAYGAPAINGDGILVQALVSRILSFHIHNGDLLEPNGERFHAALLSALEGPRVRNAGTLESLSNSMETTRFIIKYLGNLFYYVVRVDQ